MIYLITFYLAIVFTALFICISIAFKVIYFIKNNNHYAQEFIFEDPSKNLPEIDINFGFYFLIEILITIFFMSVFLGWKIVYKALSNDDFISRSAFKIYIQILLEIKNGL